MMTRLILNFVGHYLGNLHDNIIRLANFNLAYFHLH